MSRLLISRNPDLQRLRDEGYEIEVRSNLLLVHSVPYVNSLREVALGTLVSELTTASPGVLDKPGTHQILPSEPPRLGLDGLPPRPAPRTGNRAECSA